MPHLPICKGKEIRGEARHTLRDSEMDDGSDNNADNFIRTSHQN